MLIDGEKYACEACVRGHRVSNCQHHDRQLNHIAKKGRPVSQCPHCRGLRRARASHVKCECGEKPHAKEDHDKTRANDARNSPILLSPDLAGSDARICCCTHGMKCTCSIKKEHLDPVLELEGPSRPSAHILARKPALTSSHSDPLTVFKNHHHKPVHKHNHAAHDTGAPYKIPIPHSISGNSDLHKSVDSLPLPKKSEPSHAPLHDSIASAKHEARRVRSEHGSPEPGAFRHGEGNADLQPLDLPYPSYYNLYKNTSSPMGDDYNYRTSGTFDNYFSAAEEWPMLSAGLDMPSVPWSAMDLPLDNSAMSAAYSQPPSYASFDHSNVGQPGLTTSSSDEVSDVGEHTSSFMNHRPAVSTPSEIEGNPHRLSGASSYVGLPTSAAYTNGNTESVDIDAFLASVKNQTTSPVSFEGPASLDEPVDSEKFTKHGITVQDAQARAHPNNQVPPTQAMGELSLPTPTDENDPLWGTPFMPDIDDEPLIGCPAAEGWR